MGLILTQRIFIWKNRKIDMIKEKEMVPKFQLQDADGNTVKSSQLKGKKFVVYFYPRTEPDLSK